jgi:hypothetical protein
MLTVLVNTEVLEAFQTCQLSTRSDFFSRALHKNARISAIFVFQWQPGNNNFNETMSKTNFQNFEP